MQLLETVKKYQGNQWTTLGIRKSISYKIFESQQLDHLLWSLKVKDQVEYQTGDRLIRFKVTDEYSKLESIEDLELNDNYIKERKSEILSDINADGYKIIKLNSSKIDADIIESLLKSDKYFLELKDNKIYLKKNEN